MADITNNRKKLVRAEKKLNDILPLNAEQEAYVNSIHTNLVTIVDASYGTGKTFLALVEALKLVKKGKFETILYVRPYVPAIGSDQDIGSLPGGVDEKLFQFRLPVLDALKDLYNKEDFVKLFEKGVIEATTPSFLRGRSLDNTIVILEEAQNCDKALFELVMSRIGKNSKLIIIGSSEQIDLRKKGISFLAKLFDALFEVKNVGCVELKSQVRCGAMNNILKIIHELE